MHICIWDIRKVWHNDKSVIFGRTGAVVKMNVGKRTDRSVPARTHMLYVVNKAWIQSYHVS